jgi:hypothetical protein
MPDPMADVPEPQPPEAGDPRLGPLVPQPSRYVLGYILLFAGIVGFALLLGLTAWLLR